MDGSDFRQTDARVASRERQWGGGMTVDVEYLKRENAWRWQAMSVRPDSKLDEVAARLVSRRPTYRAIEARTGVPWFVVAVIHEREAGGVMSANIAQGDPWNRVRVHVPAGRGPFNSFEDAAYDALVNCAPHASRWTDWSIGGTL